MRGIWRDYARQQGALLMSRADWLRLTGDDRISGLAVWLARSDATRRRARRAARRRRRRPPQGGGRRAARRSRSSTAGQLRAFSLRIFDRSFAVTRWLQGVALAIGLAGIAASFSAQVLARRREFGTLQHLGFTRRQVLTLVASEGALWSAVGAVLGLALGLAVSVVLVKVVNPQSFHWTMQMSVPPATLAGAGRWASSSRARSPPGAAAMPRRAATSCASVKEDW